MNTTLNLPWVRALQESARQDFLRFGFPDRHQEDWKYTRVEPFLRENLNNSAAPKITFNGADGVLIMPLAEAVTTHPELVQPYLSQILQHEHAFQALNTTMMQHGVFIYIPPNFTLEQPLELGYWQESPGKIAYLRNLIIASPGSQVSIIEDYQGASDACYCTNIISEIYVGHHAQVKHYKMQRESKHSYHLSHIAVKQYEASQFENFSFSLGGKWARSDINVALHEPHATSSLGGVYAPQDKQHMDHQTHVTHEVANCHSLQDYRGILLDDACAVFHGKILVTEEAQHTTAKQTNKNLLLSSHAHVYTKPELQIFADDIVCSHGATVGQLDEDALFYLATRGIKEDAARRYLVQAFAWESFQSITLPKLAQQMSELLNMQLG